MALNHEERKATADQWAQPEFYYSYILRFEDGGFYVGSTNNPAARFTEHAVGVGAVATAGRRFKVCLVHQFGTRKEAEYNESRIQRALARGPVNVEAMVDNFGRISSMIRPEKTLRELEDEDRAFQLEMRSHYHMLQGRAGGFWSVGVFSRTACGWEIPPKITPHGGVISAESVHYPAHGTGQWPTFIQTAREEEALRAVGGRPKEVPVCRRCLDKVPQEPTEESVVT